MLHDEQKLLNEMARVEQLEKQGIKVHECRAISALSPIMNRNFSEFEGQIRMMLELLYERNLIPEPLGLSVGISQNDNPLPEGKIGVPFSREKEYLIVYLAFGSFRR